MRFVEVPTGSFEMGCTAGQTNCSSQEPAFQVKLTKPFSMQTTEVTIGHWQAVMGQRESGVSQCDDDCPVTELSWYEAVQFANALSNKEKLSPVYDITEGFHPAYGLRIESVTWDESASGYRLPTEAEWEYAARAGQDTTYSGSNDPNQVAWTRGNSEERVHRVAQKQPNAWGLYDMSGNADEWCWDTWNEYNRDDPVDPIGGPVSSGTRIQRGGGYAARPLAVSRRSHNYPDGRSLAASHGLRLVRTAQ
jgi:sulfatase modifying factor 1